MGDLALPANGATVTASLISAVLGAAFGSWSTPLGACPAYTPALTICAPCECAVPPEPEAQSTTWLELGEGVIGGAAATGLAGRYGGAVRRAVGARSSGRGTIRGRAGVAPPLSDQESDDGGASEDVPRRAGRSGIHVRLVDPDAGRRRVHRNL